MDPSELEHLCNNDFATGGQWLPAKRQTFSVDME